MLEIDFLELNYTNDFLAILRLEGSDSIHFNHMKTVSDNKVTDIQYAPICSIESMCMS